MFSYQVLLALAASLCFLTACLERTVLREPKVSSHPSILIWFVKTDKTGTRLVPVKRNLSGTNLMEQSLHELLAGPNPYELSTGLGSEIPKGTVLLGIKTQDKSIEVDLSRRFALPGGIASLTARLEQLARTTKGIACNKAVYLNIEGKRLTMTPGEGIEVKQPLNREADLK